MSSTASDQPHAFAAAHPDFESIMIVANRDHVASHLDGDVVILHLGKGAYYSLNSAGGRVWNMIQSPMLATAIRDALLAEYDVEPSVCEKDLKSLFEHLSECGLIEVCVAR